jgi:hypothetical protein
MIKEHDLTGMSFEELKDLYKLAKHRCKSNELKDILFEISKLLELKDNNRKKIK